MLFCLPAKALLASGGCLRTKGGLSLRNNSFLVATTWRVLPPTKERGRAQSHKARCSQLLKSHGRGRNKLRFAFKSLRVRTMAIITSPSSSFGCFGRAVEYPQADIFLKSLRISFPVFLSVCITSRAATKSMIYLLILTENSSTWPAVLHRYFSLGELYCFIAFVFCVFVFVFCWYLAALCASGQH